MKIILKQDIPNLGHKDDVVDVKTGYAVNYLIPKKLAIKATESNLKMLEENKRQQAHKEAKLREQAEEMAQKLKDVKITIGAKTSSSGKIFGSVTSIQIAEKLANLGFEVDKRKISFEPVKEVGTYKAKINLYRDIATEIEFEVVSE